MNMHRVDAMKRCMQTIIKRLLADRLQAALIKAIYGDFLTYSSLRRTDAGLKTKQGTICRS